MQTKIQAKNAPYIFLLLLLLCYLSPLFAVIYFATTLIPPSMLWTLLSIGLFSAFAGSLILFIFQSKFSSSKQLIIQTVEKQIPPTIQQEEDRTHLEALHNEIERLSFENESLKEENEKYKLNLGNFKATLEEEKKEAYKQLQQQQTYIRELQESLAEQKSHMEKKQQQIGLLDTKVSDLTYEIKTLLQLAEAHTTITETPSEPEFAKYEPLQDKDDSSDYTTPFDRQIHSNEEASKQLRRCIDIAQKVTGSNHFGNNLSPFMESHMDSFSIDLRRLCDNLRSENNSVVLLYSPRENTLLFANPCIKQLTGWSPDKFIQNFSNLINDTDSWNQALHRLSIRNEVSIQLPIQSKSGDNITLIGQLGTIPTGIFKQHVIAILYGSDSGLCPETPPKDQGPFGIPFR